MKKSWIWVLSVLLGVSPPLAAVDRHQPVAGPVQNAAAPPAGLPGPGELAGQFAAMVAGVVPAQVNTNQTGTNGDLQLWRNGSEDVFAYQDWGNNVYTRNAANVLQAAGVDLSAISVPSWMSGPNQQQLYATAVTPQHVLGSAHWHPMVGQPLFFVDSGSHAVSRIVEADRQITDANGGQTDLWLARLSSPLPDNIRPFRILPVDYRERLGPPAAGLPVWLCQGGIMTTASAWIAAGADDAAGSQPSPSRGFDLRFTRLAGAFAGWNTSLHGGSGSPLFLVADRQPVLLATLHYMAGTDMLGGPSVADLAAQIEAAIAELDGGRAAYRLTPLGR